MSRSEEIRMSVKMRGAGVLEWLMTQATAFGSEVYPDLHARAPALLHSIANARALVDASRGLALAAIPRWS
jgi:hypothetical protein